MTNEDVEETVADAFLLLWQNAEKLNAEYDSVKPYLGMIARNCAYNKLRKQPPGQNISFAEIEEQVAEFHLEEIVGARELQEWLRSAAQALPEPERELFSRYYFQEEKLNEIAVSLNLNQSTAKTKLARTRKALAEQLMKEGYDYGK